MTEDINVDLTKVGPHRRDEVVRRIRVLDDYIAGRKSSADAIAELGLAVSTFWTLVRTWRHSRRPEGLMGSGKERRPRVPVTDRQKDVIAAAERALPLAPVTDVMALARRLAEHAEIDLPGIRNMKATIASLRRHRGLRPEGVIDVLVCHCAVDVPVYVEGVGLVAPILSLVCEVGVLPIVLGSALSLRGPNAADTARAVLDAIEHADTVRVDTPREVQLMMGDEAGWGELRAGFDETGLSIRRLPTGGRAGREVTKLIGDRPGGLKLKPDLTARDMSRRTVQMPQGGSSVALGDVHEIIRGRLRTAFPGPRRRMLNEADKTARLVERLRKVVNTYDA